MGTIVKNLYLLITAEFGLLDKYLFENCPDVLETPGREFAKYRGNDTSLIAGTQLDGVVFS